MSDFVSFLAAIDVRKLPEAKRRGRTFLRKLSRFLEGGDKTEVFWFALQAFPITSGEPH